MKKALKKTTEKYLTEKTFKLKFSTFDAKFNAFEARFDSSARATAKSFADNAEVMAIMLKEIRSIHQDNKNFRADISSLNTDGISCGRKIENLTVRVEKLESKL